MSGGAGEPVGVHPDRSERWAGGRLGGPGACQVRAAHAGQCALRTRATTTALVALALAIHERAGLCVVQVMARRRYERLRTTAVKLQSSLRERRAQTEAKEQKEGAARVMQSRFRQSRKGAAIKKQHAKAAHVIQCAPCPRKE